MARGLLTNFKGNFCLNIDDKPWASIVIIIDGLKISLISFTDIVLIYQVIAITSTYRIGQRIF
jgi:hypothetical protein